MLTSSDRMKDNIFSTVDSRTWYVRVNFDWSCGCHRQGLVICVELIFIFVNLTKKIQNLLENSSIIYIQAQLFNGKKIGWILMSYTQLNNLFVSTTDNADHVKSTSKAGYVIFSFNWIDLLQNPFFLLLNLLIWNFTYVFKT